MAAQVTQAAVAHREERINLERGNLELQAEQKAQVAAQVAAQVTQAAIAARAERSNLENSNLGLQAEQKAQLAAQVTQAAVTARSNLEHSNLGLQGRAEVEGSTEQKPGTVWPNNPGANNPEDYQNQALIGYTRHMLSPKQSGDGVCLDGSQPGFYFSPAPAGSKHNNSWVLYLASGGFCTDPEACLVRSKTMLGSSTLWGESLPKTAMRSWLSSDPEVSPFHDFHKAVLMYCDGASFSGHVDNPINVGKDRIYLRGRLVLSALIRELGHLGLGSAKQELLLSGGSAGGLGAILQGDRVRAMLPLVEKFKVVSFAGWFRTDIAACYDTATCPWFEVMRHAHVLHQMRGSSDTDSHVESECLREHGWRCMHASLAAQRMEAPLYLAQSSLDAWQLANIWRGSTFSSGTIDTGSCIGSLYEGACHAEEIRDLNGE